MNRSWKTYSAAVLICIVSTMTGCAREGGLEKARQYLNKGELDAAMLEARNVLQQDSLNAEAQVLVGRIFTARGDSKSAEQEIRKAGKLGLDRVHVDAALAEALLVGGHFQRVLNEIQPHGQMNGESAARVLVARGSASLALGKKDDALRAFDEALRASPQFPGALLGQARVFLLDKEIAKAMSLVEHALAEKPTYLDAWSMKADIALANGKPQDAIAAYLEAVKAVPGNILPRLAAARLQIATDKLTEAQAQLDHLRKVASKNPLVDFTQALLYFRQRNFPLAQEFAQNTLKLAPYYAPAALVLAASELAMGSTEQAEERFRSALQAFPHSPLVRKLYAAAMLEMNRPERALEAIAPALDQTEQDPEIMSIAGQIFMQTGDYAKASAFMDKAARMQPGAASGLVALGLRQLAGGETERGLAELEKAATLDTTGIRADFVLALAHLRRKEFDKALEAARRLEQKQPRNPIAHNLAGAAYLGNGDREAARRSIERALELDASYLPASINLALLDIEQGQADVARARLEKVLDRDPGNIDAIAALARLSGKPGEMARLLEQARARDEKAIGVRLMLVRQNLVDNNVSTALQIAQEAERAAPDNPEALDALGAAQFAAGQRKEAFATYSKLIAKAPNSALAHERLGQVQEAMGDSKAAEDAYKKAVSLSPESPEPVAGLVRLYGQLGRTAEALALVEGLRKRFPRSPLGDELRGDLFARQKKYAEAARAYDAAYALAPSGAMAVKHHGASRLAGSTTDGARLQQWLKANPSDVATRQYLADQQLQAGELSAAAENYRRVLEIQPRNAFAMNNLANVYLLQKDPRALATAEAALRLSPQNANIMDTVGLALTESGAPARALPYLKKAVSLNPDVVEYRVHLASALAKTGDKDAARAEIKRLLDAGKPVQLDDATRASLK